jgi:hypothetical protein
LKVNGPENPNHYADIDAPFGPTGETWRQMCLADNERISVAAWQDYYREMAQRAADRGDTDAADQYREPLKQGLVPFRVWQFFNAMVGFVEQSDLTGYLAAAGILAHYVGDATQPLHGSIFADGDPSRPVDRLDDHGNPAFYGKGVHVAYESTMVTEHAGDLITLIDAKLAGRVDHGLALCDNGKGAARATLTLMDEVAAILSPTTLLDSFEANLSDGRNLQSTRDAMWRQLGDATAEVMIHGAATLAMIWDAAWRKGGGSAALLAGGAPRDEDLRARYVDNAFLQSCTLNVIGPFLT